jgi:hypothetical protein
MKVRKRPIAVEAMQYTGGNRRELQRWMVDSAQASAQSADTDDRFRIATLEGEMTVSVGDWVIKGIQGEFYPCKPDIFLATYERVTDGGGDG